MLIATCVALALGPNTDGLPPIGHTVIGERPYFVSQDREVLECQLRNSFILTDSNRDGFVDAGEAPMATAGRTLAKGERVETEASTSLWIQRVDRNDDGRVEWQEMRAHFLPGILQRNGLSE